MTENRSPFLDTLFLLRKEESMTVFIGLQEIPEKEMLEAADYFRAEFEKERLEFQSAEVMHHQDAALWAAKILYHSAQLYLVRRDTSTDLKKFIPDYTGKIDVSAILSADLSLRFVPQVLAALQIADPEDPLIVLLESLLTRFHYSGIGTDLDLQNINWQDELKNATYRKLYLERIVEKKDYKLAEIPYINQLLIAEFGMYKDVFWKELKDTRD
ncbi:MULTISPECIES: hypothetical protein [Chryseobacterium]|uniref:MoxR-vWA-beta-propeller ternary system domain-containing protein n=1 Tax=Chryseobacterium camelliae TaxID=1265445 RepID=A0ABU0TDB6_9FLAO|nr:MULTISPECIES: hypothetical protein [Chryseobacterium]MDT3407228.1 hypothetical protein [Pseudacidovorax intermedius]MDQ1094982.1 hypothetical protein [Chryseobacterium camelliae]MDQ1098922.1 hypothetical protein [Chryseobacterium sp. SORGH_AS_1048]MDR6086270.1 hypothetical protein [Chryseobacterium sp. SORGH_AS_0909]MDR6130641.1 hypothetical protein [Chryseobacterium sp. SORGH_AS_1175]